MTASGFNQQVVDINTERTKATFNPADLTPLFYGGVDKLERIQELQTLLDNDPIFDRERRLFMGRTERFQNALPIVKRYVELRNQHGFTPEEGTIIKNYMDEGTPMHLHETMFMPLIRAQASDEQFAQWGPLGESYRWIGAYAQTEIGHGSNLSRLETTATLDLKTDEWVINSPTQSSAKCWIGGLGKAATHAAVQAKLIINGKDYGAHPFLVQVRSLQDHTAIPGLEVIDMGPKQGFAGLDNAIARFNNVRIPRTNMMMRFSQVTREGKYIKPPNDKLAYGTMTAVRTGIISKSAHALARGACIAVRYCAVRRQGTVDPKTNLEAQVLDYPSVQLRLLPLLSFAFSTMFSAVWIDDLFEAYQTNVSKGDFSLLKDVHVYSSGLKSYVSKVATDGVEEARRTLGGHGYSIFSGLIDFNRNVVAAVTYEGENNLLTQQVSRYLLKLFKSVLADKNVQLSDSSRYITGLLNPQQFANEKCQARSIKDFYNPKIVAAAFQHRSARLLKEMYNREKEVGGVWSELNIDCIRLSQAHVQLFMIENFYSGLQKYYGQPTKERPVVNKNLLEAVLSLYHLHVFSTMNQELSEFLEDGYFSPAQASWVRESLRDCLKTVRPNAVAFADSFGFTDKLLNSALGSYDGRAYERLEEMARLDPLNSKAMNKDGRIWGYEEYLRPLIKGEIPAFAGKTRLSKL